MVTTLSILKTITIALWMAIEHQEEELTFLQEKKDLNEKQLREHEPVCMHN